MHHFFHRMRHCADDIEAAWMIGRHRHGHGFGPSGHGFMGEGGLGRHGFRTGRKLGSSDLQIVLLALLADRPSHGYELIKALEEHSGGFYSPSPGVIYPALTYLEEVGYASVAAEGTKKLYSITTEGRAYLDEHRESADAILAQLERIGSKMGRVREIFSGFGDDEFAESKEILAARRELKMALRERKHANAAERKRIVDIIKRAAAAIRSEGGER
ncbi:MAG TPA: PadR family transcriptional regulator [Rudaea sp.]|jgi:DNA-binding PadR family transcriptional regulator|nr:PadR family transcriptional regulator [Rudaea sp.]